MFGGMYEDATTSGAMGGLVAGILPNVGSSDLEMVNIYLGIIIIVHALISAIAIKIVDGGNKLAAVLDFTFMLWIGAAVSWIVPIFSEKLMPGLGVG